MSILRKWSGHPLQFPWNFTEIVITPYDEHHSRGAQIVHIWPCLRSYYCQTALVNNPNFSGMQVILPNIEKITLSTLWLSKVKGHGPQNWLFLALAINFRKFSSLTTLLFLDSFRSYLEELLLIKLPLTLENFTAKYQKVCEISWAKLGTKWKN